MLWSWRTSCLSKAMKLLVKSSMKAIMSPVRETRRSDLALVSKRNDLITVAYGNVHLQLGAVRAVELLLPH